VIILGIDPGSRVTGYGLIKVQNNHYQYVASGCIRTVGEVVSDRLYQIFEGLSSIIRQHGPDEVAIEKIFLKKNIDSAFKLGQARGAAFVAAASSQLSVAEYAPRLVKKSIVGYGHAEKHQVQEMIKILLCLPGVPQSDAADALAIALCHANHRQCHNKPGARND
jgi:crossover junction endodeoxyribonuclease RuvC